MSRVVTLCLVLFFTGLVSAADYPLQVSDNQRYLETAGGKPFLVVGDTALVADRPVVGNGRG